MSMRQGVSWLTATLLSLSAGVPAISQAPPADESDCLSENANKKNKMQFFVCLNSKREYWQDQLIKVQTECQPNSLKYAGAYSRYLILRNKANLLIDMLIAELKYGDNTPPEKFKQLMQSVNTSSQDLDKYLQGTTCDGASNRFLPLLIPLITAAFLDRSRFLLDGWLSGNRNIKDQRVMELTSQRWRSPQEFGAMPPTAPPTQAQPTPSGLSPLPSGLPPADPSLAPPPAGLTPLPSGLPPGDPQPPPPPPPPS
jgi:hypothetical protein